MSPDGSAVSCHGVTRTYRTAGGSVEALHAVTADFAAGTIGAVVGPSGTGKSTLLRLLAGLDTADDGVIEVGGIDVTALRGRQLRNYRRSTAAFVSQRAAANLVPHLRLDEQLGRSGGTTLAGELGLDHRLRALASELSGGEQARAALAVALSRGTSVLFVDEPTAELDHAATTRVIAVLERLAAEGRTIVVATHDPDVVDLASTRVELAPHRSQHPATPLEVLARRPGETVIALRDVTKRYDGRTAVGGASLELATGRLGALIGRSGSGKSTLLMVAGGWVPPDSGEVSVPGGRPPAWSGTAYLAQRFALLSELTVAENVSLPLRIAGGGDGRVVESLLDGLSLRDVAGRLPSEISIGQQQRTALGRALALRPAALLADEPTSHQDSGSAELVWRTLRHATQSGTACLVATHDPSAAEHADVLWNIDDGRVTPGRA